MDTKNEERPMFVEKGRKRSSYGHFTVLMRKNFIAWRRTLFGSLCELLCPVLTMFVLVYLRKILEI